MLLTRYCPPGWARVCGDEGEGREGARHQRALPWRGPCQPPQEASLEPPTYHPPTCVVQVHQHDGAVAAGQRASVDLHTATQEARPWARLEGHTGRECGRSATGQESGGSRTDPGLALHPDQVAGDAQRVLVDRNHLLGQQHLQAAKGRAEAEEKPHRGSVGESLPVRRHAGCRKKAAARPAPVWRDAAQVGADEQRALEEAPQRKVRALLGQRQEAVADCRRGEWRGGERQGQPLIRLRSLPRSPRRSKRRAAALEACSRGRRGAPSNMSASPQAPGPEKRARPWL